MFFDIVLQYNLLLLVFEEVRKIIMKALALVGSHITAWTQEKQWAHRNLKVLKQTVSKVASPSKLDLRSSILNLWLSIFFWELLGSRLKSKFIHIWVEFDVIIKLFPPNGGLRSSRNSSITCLNPRLWSLGSLSSIIPNGFEVWEWSFKLRQCQMKYFCKCTCTFLVVDQPFFFINSCYHYFF